MRASLLLVAGLAWACVPVGAGTARAGTVTTLFKFGQDGGNACNPVLSFVSGGLLTGTTQLGGTKALGLLFSLDPKTGTLTHLHDFSGGRDGQNPSGAVLYNGLVYGVTNQTPMPSFGNVYSVDPATGTFTVVHVFKQYQNGVLPGGNMIVVDGLLYGGTVYGGVPNAGGVFSVNPATGNEVFSALAVGQGKYTAGPLLPVGNKLYGIANEGGRFNNGSIFALDLAGRRITTVYKFQGGMDGAGPDGPLVQAGHALFGTTNLGGGSGYGTVFKIDLDTGRESVVNRFAEASQGLYPSGYLALVNGLIYGTTASGGANNAGTIYTIDPVSGAHTVVYDFTGGNSDYGGPLYGLLYKDGVFYGTTGSFGLHDPCGTAFSYVP